MIHMKSHDIISKNEFRYNLLDAALSTKLFGKENGFSCYTDKDYASHFINEARAGESKLISRREISDIPGKGFHTPEGHYDTIWLHTHTKTMWHPSVGDLNANSDFRFVNNQYKDLYDGQDVLSDQKEPYTHGSGYGHIAVCVENLEEEHNRLMELNLKPLAIKEFKRDDSLMAKFFFIQDPDGYKIEVLQRFGRYQ